MLLNFKVKNYRSFREEVLLSFEAAALKEYTDCLISVDRKKYLPTLAIYGKNGSGKSNLVRALWLAVQFIVNSQRTQHEKALIPVRPFELDDYSSKEATGFEFEYLVDGVRHIYGFEATREKIMVEYLYNWPRGQKSKVFKRTEQKFSFPTDAEKKKKEVIVPTVAANQLFLAMACVLNYGPCLQAMRWFREKIIFSRDYSDVRVALSEFSEDEGMLKAMVDNAKIADLGIEDIDFNIDKIDIKDLKDIPPQLQFEIREKLAQQLSQLQSVLQSGGNDIEAKLRLNRIKASVTHYGIDRHGNKKNFLLDFADESDGTRRLMVLAPAIEKTLAQGGTFIVDELERELHPVLMEYIVKRYQNAKENKHQGQLLFTTHNTELLSLEVLRRDQIVFVDKDRQTGVSEVYSLQDFSPRKDENIHKGYILGKYGAVPLLAEEF